MSEKLNRHFLNKSIHVFILVLLFSMGFFLDAGAPPQAYAEDNIFTDKVGLGATGPGSQLSVFGSVGIGSTTPSNDYLTTLAPDGGLIVQGNVGIGTTGPNSKLDVNGGVRTTAAGGVRVGDHLWTEPTNIVGSLKGQLLQTQGTNERALLAFAPNGTSNLADFWLFATSDITTDYERMIIGYDGSDNYFHITTDAGGTGTERPLYLGAGGYAVADHQLVLATSGNVGIGTTNPGYKLEVNGTFDADTITEGGSAVVSAADLDHLDAADGSPANAVYVDNSGNVGIGSTAPSALLTTSGTTEQLRLEYDSSNYQSLTVDSSGDLFIAQDGGAATLALTNGSVGIGTTGPSTALQVVGTVTATTFSGNGSGLTGITNAGGWIDNASNVYLATTADNVGLGTSSPGAYKLDIVGDLRVGATDFFVDDSAGRVGIGTTSPLSMLQLGNAVGAHVEVWTDTSNPQVMISGVDNETDVEALRIQDENLNPLFSVRSTGNVGIGTTTPDVKLEVIHNAAITSFTGDQAQGIRIANIGENSYALLGFTGWSASYATRNLAQIGASILGSGSSLHFGTSSSYATGITNTAMTIDSTGSVGIGTVGPVGPLHVEGTGDVLLNASGNVGIGTTNPGYKLEVNGTFDADTITEGGSAVVSAADLDHLDAADGSPANAVYVDNSGNVGIGSTAPSALLTTSGTTEQLRLEYDSSNYQSLTVDSSGDLFIAQDGGAATLALTNGSVGIGTTAPSTALEVVGTVTATTFSGDGSGITGITSAGGWTDGGANVYLATSTDNVGIGTTAPERALHIESAEYGPIYSKSTLAAGYGGTLSYNDAGTAGIFGIGGTTHPSWPSKVFIYANAQDIILDTSGNVGIGTTGPDAALDIRENSNEPVKWGSISAAFGRLSYTTGMARIMSESGNKLSLGGGTYDHLIVDTNGNVGIGTTAPLAKLHTFGTDFPMFLMDGDGTADSHFSIRENTTTAGTNIFYSGDLTFETQTYANRGTATGSTERIRIDSSGNVGIGTTGPNNTLQVAGLINFDDTLNNVGLGTLTLSSITTGASNVAIGKEAGEKLTEGNYNTFIGRRAGEETTTGDNNLAIGYDALTANTTGGRNFAIGIDALMSSVGNWDNMAFGSYSLYKLTSGTLNTGIGQDTMMHIDGGIGNLAMGYGALKSSDGDRTGINYNVAIGYAAMNKVETGASSNVAIGYQAGFGITTADANIFIGYKAGINQTTNSNLLIIDNQDRGSAAGELTNSLLYGVFNATVANQSLRINTGNVLIPTGSVGIGTTNPSSALEVVGTITATTFSGDGSGITGITSAGGFTDGGSNVYLATTADNVGLGTSSPGAYKLDIVGDLRVGGTDFFVDDSAGTVGIGTTSPDTILHVESANDQLLNLKSTDATAYIRLQDTADSFYLATGSQVGSIGGNAGVNAGNLNIDLTNGNVGIGTTAPGSNLHVRATGASDIAIDGGNYYSMLRFLGNGTEYWNFYLDGNTKDLWIIEDNADTRVTFQEGGNVGIGTTNPGYKLEVNGTFDADTITEGGSAVVSAADLDHLDAADGSPANAVYVDNSGNVGIGTTGPGAKLHVLGAQIRIQDADPKLALYDVAGNERAYLTMTSTGVTTLAADNTISLSPNNVEVVHLDGAGAVANSIYVKSGNVGIGTTTPGRKLEVQGHINIGTTSGYLFNNYDNQILVGADSSGYYLFSGNGNTFDEDIFIGSDRAIIKGTTGNVGIGTANPSERLEVAETGKKSFEVKPETNYVSLLVSGVEVARMYD